MKLQFYCVAIALLAVQSGYCKGPCTLACNDLRARLGSSHVTTKGRNNLYWAKQTSEIQPACYVRPSEANQVSVVLKVAKQHNCPFAIRGGGHSDVPGASNLQDGMTLDLGALKRIVVSEDRTVASVGPGLNWGAAYTTLDAQNLTVVGGRETTVGVAGLTLGGGISYFSGLHGFACDNVKNYEVVLASEKIVQVNATSKYQDLYRALRGGGNNFGIITRFDLDAYSYHLMEGGLNLYNDSAELTVSQIDAFTNFARTAPSDPHAALFTSLDYIGGRYVWFNGYYYTKPRHIPSIPIFRPYYGKQFNSSLVSSTVRTTNHSDLARELGTTQPSGFREQFHTATFQVNKELMAKMFQIFREETKRVQESGKIDSKTFSANMAFQPISKNILQQQLKRDGNVLGLTVQEAPLMLLSMAWPWNNTSNDGLIIDGMNRVVRRSVHAAKEMGLFNKFIYMNYAAPGEAVVASYGKNNSDFMTNVAFKYDPKGVFQNLVPGGFKLAN